MLSAPKAEPKWEISVIPAMKKAIIVNVPKNCSTAELYDEVKKHPLSPVAVQHVLMSTEGELENSLNKYLSDYDIENRSIVQLMAKVNGGLWPADDDSDTEPFETSEEMEVTEEYPDVFGFDDEDPRAIMTCGHAVAPLSLALHCYDELENGEESIRCPDPDCRAPWKFSQIREAVSLSVDESQEFERKVLFNRMQKKQEEIRPCPECGTFCTRRNDTDDIIVCSNCTALSGKLFEFCWTCLTQRAHTATLRCENPECDGNQWLYAILALCTLTEVNGVECPSKRACPRCYAVIEHVKVCKDRTCDYCEHEFCFFCLKPYPCKTDVWGTCDVAPRQTPAPRRPIMAGEDRWQIFVKNVDWKTIVLNVPADCFVDEFFRLLYDHPKTPKCCGYRVTSCGVQLDNRERKRLSAYRMSNNCNVFLLLRLCGGLVLPFANRGLTWMD